LVTEEREGTCTDPDWRDRLDPLPQTKANKSVVQGGGNRHRRLIIRTQVVLLSTQEPFGGLAMEGKEKGPRTPLVPRVAKKISGREPENTLWD